MRNTFYSSSLRSILRVCIVGLVTHTTIAKEPPLEKVHTSLQHFETTNSIEHEPELSPSTTEESNLSPSLEIPNPTEIPTQDDLVLGNLEPNTDPNLPLTTTPQSESTLNEPPSVPTDTTTSQDNSTQTTDTQQTPNIKTFSMTEIIQRLEATPSYQASKYQLQQDQTQRSSQAMHQELQTTESILAVAQRISQYGEAAQALLRGDDISEVIATLERIKASQEALANASNPKIQKPAIPVKSTLPIPQPEAHFVHRTEHGFRVQVRLGEHVGELFEKQPQQWGDYTITLLHVDLMQRLPIHLRVNQKDFAIAIR